MFLPRSVARVALAVALATPVLPLSFASAQPTDAPAASLVTPEQLAAVKPFVENFWHFGKIGRYELASAEAQKVVDAAVDPVVVLTAFEQVAEARKDNLDQWMIRFAGIEGLKDATAKLQEKISAGHIARRSDPAAIRQHIERLSVNERAYALAVGRLRQSGELAVPFMIDYLRDNAKAEYHAGIRRALRDMGRSVVNPLTAATEMGDADVLLVVVSALGDLGYDDAGPFLARLVESESAPATVKEASRQAMNKLGVSGKSADLFTQLAEKLYYDRSAIAVDSRSPAGYVWFWSNDRGLHKTDVPTPIFNELMAMRAAEYALKLGGGQGDALSLWLASNYKREVELPEGATDPTRQASQPDAHYYGVSAGAQYLNSALARALRDRNSALALKIIQSLQDIAGQSNFASGGGTPLVDALTFDDRRVRFEAAFALAQALPQQSFQGSERVVPLLAEAVAQTGLPSALLVMPTQDEVNSLIEGMKGAGGVIAEGSTSAEAAIAAGQSMTAVDVIIVSEELGAAEIDKLFSLAGKNPKLSGAARLVLTKTGASPYEVQKTNDPLLSTAQASDAQAVKAAMEAARVKAGALPMDAQVATAYATRAAQLLQRLAISRGQVMDVSVARASLLQSLNDQRPEIVKLVGQTLALIDSPDAQAGLLDKAMAEGVSDDVRVSLYQSLATSAKFFGNKLDAGKTDELMKVVAEAQNLEVRSAAAEAHGALNLPADQAKRLVVEQMRV
jgi:hypothetical protein